MIQLLRRPLNGVALVLGVTLMHKQAVATTPSKSFMSTCKTEFVALDSIGLDQYAEGIYTFVTYDLMENNIFEADGYDDTQLRKTILKKNGQLRSSYTKHLPSFVNLPAPIMDVFAEFSCSSSAKPSTFCSSYYDGSAKSSKIPSTSVITNFSSNQAKQAANSICSTIYDYWDDLITSAGQFYVEEGLVVPMVWSDNTETTPLPSTYDYSASPTPTGGGPAPVSNSSAEITKGWGGHSTNVTASIQSAPAATQSQETPSSKSAGLTAFGTTLLIAFAAFVAAMGFFLYRRRRNADPSNNFSPVTDSDLHLDGNIFGEDDDGLSNEEELIIT
eukprot:CAMPEP_0172432150 /NCGR_PEP_ID=MMETSP1064-20121228/61769_1 /TAXON_ID=202472 /ORGANISM="Aulacoseira subarctica , Strain CCAP 1002/5" /LENGTH=330 /DNA_ID=CAMNT_0013179247 /DNA_START=70 /DNA_END=1065 /DNA_ORIENTATION=-